MRIFLKTVYFSFWIFIMLASSLILGATKAHVVKNPDFLTPEYLNLAFQGNFLNIEEVLKAKANTGKGKVLLEKVRARFIERTDGLNLKNEDPLIQKIGALYQDYWRDAMLDPDKREEFEETLEKDIAFILKKEGLPVPGNFKENYEPFLQEKLEKRGYYGLFGRTLPLMEFMVWKTNDKKVHRVELTDGIYEFEVNYLSDFVSLGWGSFASFGGPSTGGWATREGLFVVTPRWDLESEAFKVSYFMHEGRHFADYKKYPNLKQPDLEYRAKLTELAFAVEDRLRILKIFADHAAKVDTSPHALANWHVITDISRELLGTDWPADPDIWKTLQVEEIQATAKKLLERHNQLLDEAGVATTTGIIKP